MKKKMIGILILLMLMFPVLSVYGSPQNIKSLNNNIITIKFADPNIVDMITQINKSMVFCYLENFTEFGPKSTGSENCKKAGEYIFNEFEEMGLDVYFHNWKFVNFKDRNVVATLNGIDPNSDAIFIVCAHYDTAGDSPGANDDGSGIAVMLSVAKIMSQYSFNHTVRFVAFSGHEVGTYGSFAYAKKVYAQDDNIVGILNMDMIGNSTESVNILQMRKSSRTEWISHFTQEIIEKYEEYIDIVLESVTDIPHADETSFLDYGYDAVLYFNPNWWKHPNHCPEDDLSSINFDFLTNVTKLILAVTAELVNKPIDVQIRIVSPMEGHFQLFDRLPIKLPGINWRLTFSKLKGLTYIHRKTAVIRVNITSKEEINAVYYSLDGVMNWKATFWEPPYEWKIEDSLKLRRRIPGVHIIGVTVTTSTGKTAYDEMDVLIFPLI